MLDGTSVDRPLPEVWATLIDAPFEENDAIFGLQTLQDYCVPGYKPENLHIHILLLLALGRAPRQVLYDTSAVELASQAILVLNDLLAISSKASSLGDAIPPCGEDTESCINYVARHYALHNAAQRLIESARAGFWDMVLESRKQRDHKRRQPKEEAGASEVNQETLFQRPRKKARKSGSPIKVESSKQAVKALKEEDEPGEDDEVVVDRAWALIAWAVRLWEKDQLDQQGSSGQCFSPLFMRQIPPPRGSTIQWDISRIMVIIACAFQEDEETDQDWAVNDLGTLERMTVAAKLIKLMLSATLTSPNSKLTPSTLQFELVNLIKRLNPTILELILVIIPDEPSAFRQRVLAEAVQDICGTELAKDAPHMRAAPKKLAAHGSSGLSTAKAFATSSGHPATPIAPYAPVTIEEYQHSILLCKVPQTAGEQRNDAIKLAILHQALLSSIAQSSNQAWPSSDGGLKAAMEATTTSLLEAVSAEEDRHQIAILQSSMMKLLE